MIQPALRLRRAILRDDAILVRRILKSYPTLLHNPDTSGDGLSNSNLHLAASLGHVEVCKALIDLGHEEPLPALNEQHQTALMLAAANGKTDTVHLLAEKSPDAILRRDVRGRDAIMEASRGGHDTAVQILLTWVPGGAQAALQHADVDGNTALHFASSEGHLLVLRTLLVAGADPDRTNAWSWSAVAYSQSVQAEVYLKGLIAAETKEKKRNQAPSESLKGGTVRLVDQETGA